MLPAASLRFAQDRLRRSSRPFGGALGWLRAHRRGRRRSRHAHRSAPPSGGSAHPFGMFLRALRTRLRTSSAVGRPMRIADLQVCYRRPPVVVPAPGPAADVAIVKAGIAQLGVRVQALAAARGLVVGQYPVDEVVRMVGQLHAPDVTCGVAHRDRTQHPAVTAGLLRRLQGGVVDRLQ